MKNYTIWSPEYNNFSGGIRALHILNNELNKKGFNSFLHYQNQHNENNIVLYPEIISDNPLNSEFVCRWLLANGEKKDLCFEWVSGLGADFLLTVNIIDLEIFKPRTKNRKGIGYWIGKGAQNIDLPENAIKISKFEPTDRSVLAELLASFEYIISFDSFTAVNFEATLVGTPVFIANTTLDWTEKKLKDTKWPFFGIFWDMKDLEQAKNSVEFQFEAYKQLLNKFDESIDSFIEISQKTYA